MPAPTGQRSWTRALAVVAASLLATAGLTVPWRAEAGPAPQPMAVTVSPDHRGLAQQCGTAERVKPRTQSPITGYFVFQDSDPCVAMEKMASLRSISADTAITFGSRINKFASVDEAGRPLTADGEVDPKWADCIEGEVTCLQAASAAVPNSTLRHRLYYSNPEHLGDQALRCPGRDATVVHNGHQYQRMLLPVGEDLGCDAEHDAYDVVLVDNGPEGGPNLVESMLTAADAYGVDYWIGMPVPDKDPKSPWLPDAEALDYAMAFSERLFADWQDRYSHHRSWAGVYQSTEIPMKSNAAWDAAYELYTAQHHLAAEVMPDRPIMISPYIDARPAQDVPIDMVDDSFIRLANTAPEGTRIIVAPQDGRGTNKVGVYFPDQVDDIVEELLWDTVGEVPYGEAYQGTTGDYFASAGQGRVELDNPDAELWINVEVMQRGVGEDQETCDDGRSIAAPYERVAKQLSVAQSRPVSKVIAYMYDGLMTCTNPGIDALQDQMVAADGQPIPTGAQWVNRGARSGLEIPGYFLSGAAVTVSWTTSDGDVEEQTFSRGQLHWSPRVPGAAVGVQSVWLPLEADLSAEAPWLRITMETAAGPIPYGEYVVTPH